VFENVFPFFGSLDIRDSSKKRSQAIEKDLKYNLHAAHKVLQSAHTELSFDILGELILDVESIVTKLQHHFTTGEEITITDFIRDKVNTVIAHLSSQYPQLGTSPSHTWKNWRMVLTFTPPFAQDMMKRSTWSIRLLLKNWMRKKLTCNDYIHVILKNTGRTALSIISI
jgi:hypothetical protein